MKYHQKRLLQKNKQSSELKKQLNNYRVFYKKTRIIIKKINYKQPPT